MRNPAIFFCSAYVLVSLTVVLGTQVVLALLALDQGATPFEVGLIAAFTNFLPLLGSWRLGVLVDRYGARWILLGGAIAGLVGLGILYVSTALPAIYAAAVLYGLYFMCSVGPLQTVVGVASTANERTRNFANFSLFGSATNFLGPVCGGFAIDHLGKMDAIAALAVIPLVAAIAVLAWGHVLPGGTHKAATAAGRVEPALFNRQFVTAMTLAALAHLATDLFRFYMPIYGHHIQISASAIGGVMAAAAAAQFVSRIFLSRFVAAVSEEGALAYAFALGSLGFILTPFCQDMWTLGAAAFAFGLATGYIGPLTIMLTFSAQGDRPGEALGLRQTTNNSVKFIGPMVFGLLASTFGLTAVFMVSAAFSAGGGALARYAAALRRGRTSS